MSWSCEHNYSPSEEHYYLYISSEDCKQLFPKNNISHFEVELPETLYLSKGKWEIALMEATYDKDIHKDYESMYLLCNLCEDSFVHNNKQPILRKVQWNTSYRVLQHFVDVTTTQIRHIRLRFVDLQLQPVTQSGSFYCTLLLQKKRT